MVNLLSLERLGVVNRQPNLSRTITWLHEQIRKGVMVTQCTRPLRVQTETFPEGHTYPAGTLLLEDCEAAPDGVLLESIADPGLKPAAARRLRLPQQLAVYNGLNSGDFCINPYRDVFAAFGLPFIEIGDKQIRDGILDSCDLLIVPGGPDAGESYYAGLGDTGMESIHRFIRQGGRYIGSCAGAYLPLTARPGVPEQRMWLNAVNATDPQGLDYWRTGTGFVRLKLTTPDHPVLYGLAYGEPSTIDVIYWEGPMFDISDPSITVLATYEDFLASGAAPPSWSVQDNPSASDALSWSNPLTPDRFLRYMKDVPAAIETHCGDGRLILFSFHPEFGSPVAPWNNSITLLFIINAIYELCSAENR